MSTADRCPARIRTWTQRGIDPGLFDCPEAAALAALKVAGVPALQRDFTAAEQATLREQFEDAQGIPESQQEHGDPNYSRNDTASMAMFGVKMHAAHWTTLAVNLAKPDLVFTIGGQGSGLPSGVKVPHSCAFETVRCPDGVVRVFVADPVTPANSEPDEIPAATVVARAHNLVLVGGQQDYRWARVGEFAQEAEMPFTKPKAEDWRVKAIKGAVVYDAPDGNPIGAINAGATVRTLGETADGVWRLTVLSGRFGAVKRADLEPLVYGGDPKVDALLQAVIGRIPLVTAADRDSAVTAAVKAIKVKAKAAADAAIEAA